MKQISTFFFLITFISLNAQTYQSSWQNKPNMPWLGEELWANRLQDWQIKNGSLSCNITGKNRSVALLTHKIIDSFEMSVVVTIENLTPTPGVVGFQLNRRGPAADYRSAAIYGRGIAAGINKKGQLVIGNQSSAVLLTPQQLSEAVELRLNANEATKEVRLVARNAAGETTGEFAATVADITGYVALLSNFDTPIQQEFLGSATFKNWRVSGVGVVANFEQTYGPIFFAQYTVSNNTLKLSAQCAPTDLSTDKLVLSFFEAGEWREVLTESIDKTSRTASFRIPNWVKTEAIPYRLSYAMPLKNGKEETYTYAGQVAPQPNATDEIKLGLFSCNFDHGFPDGDLREKMLYHAIDAALFLGDQFYEGSGGFGVEVTTLPRSVLDYLRKWYQFGWSYRDVFRNVPMISIPDDHDVYHGNVWGESGKAALLSGDGYERQDVGGYKMPAEWIKMVQHTQTNHLPDAFDPTPVLQNIPVYYTHWNWGPLSFAIIEDRKFKSAPQNIFPPEAQVANGFITNPDFKIGAFNTPPDGELLGKRQEAFLQDWVHDWRNGAQMKIMLSQTNFCTLATLPAGSISDADVPSLPIPARGEYLAGDAPTQDMDSNGWPHNKRNEAVSIIRKGFTLHLAGDQHLASVVQYGVDEYDDAGFAFAGPALNNIWPRRWWPQVSADHEPIQGKAKNTGKFEDGFANKVTVHAVGNPYQTGIEPAIIHDRATGYGIVRLKPASREITLECWPRFADPAIGRQFDGWPITIKQEDNYGREAFGYLPAIKIMDYENAVVQVINQKTKETIYSLRISGDTFLPKVFEAGVYTVRYGEPDKNVWQELQNLTVTRFGRRIKTKLFLETN